MSSLWSVGVIVREKLVQSGLLDGKIQRERMQDLDKYLSPWTSGHGRRKEVHKRRGTRDDVGEASEDSR
jgi:hypothetical protein